MTRTAALTASLLALLSLVACGGDRQHASLALDEARLAVSGARRKGAERLAARTMGVALRELHEAEGHFASQRYARVEEHARRAVEAAGTAGREASAASSGSVRSARRTKRRK